MLLSELKQEGREEGLAEGLARGREEGRKEGQRIASGMFAAKLLLNDQFTEDVILRTTGVDPELFEEIRRDPKNWLAGHKI